MPRFISLFVLVSLSLFTGCASIISGSTQAISVTPMHNGAIDTQATCTATNKKGSWVTNGGGTIIIKKSRDDLQVRCNSADQALIGTQVAARSTQAGWAVANFFLWDFCTISCIIDFSSGSIYEYPTQVQVPMQRTLAATQMIPSEQSTPATTVAEDPTH